MESFPLKTSFNTSTCRPILAPDSHCRAAGSRRMCPLTSAPQWPKKSVAITSSLDFLVRWTTLVTTFGAIKWGFWRLREFLGLGGSGAQWPLVLNALAMRGAPVWGGASASTVLSTLMPGVSVNMVSYEVSAASATLVPTLVLA
eukprot:4934544-Amphidinium_carterae.1